MGHYYVDTLHFFDLLNDKSHRRHFAETFSSLFFLALRDAACKSKGTGQQVQAHIVCAIFNCWPIAIINHE